MCFLHNITLRLKTRELKKKKKNSMIKLRERKRTQRVMEGLCKSDKREKKELK